MAKEIVHNGVHDYSSEEKWIKPDDDKVIQKLEWFKDQKLGLMMHWAPGCQLGTFESWPLCDGAASWSRKDINWTEDMEEFKRQYFNLNKTFNPIRFQPEEWAKAAKKGGFKYLIFTTKHHDGFCMWDTKTTDYKITGSDCPFHLNKNADICKQLFNSFRGQGLGIATYFSKADWHVPYYWVHGMECGSFRDRGPTYNPKEYPWLWDKFIEFTHNQIMELMSEYGNIDILWLDAGWVAPSNGQDIRLGDVVKRAREKQPGLIVADRTVGGIYENYITPEQTVPEKPLNVPWESCITMSGGFSYRYEENYKSLRQILHIFIDIISKGGNLALNVAPQPDGRLAEITVKRMIEIGEWLELYGEAVYGTRVCPPYRQDNCAFTCKGEEVYCFYLYEENEEVKREVFIPYTQKRINGIVLLDSQEKVDFVQSEKGITFTLPENKITKETPIVNVFKFRF